jgi:hypothetical protein
MWSERILVAIGYCRAKAQSMTSGKKLLSQCPAVKCIVEVIQKVSQKNTGQELVQRGKKLMQHQTPEAKPRADTSGDLDSQNSKATVDSQSSKGKVAHQSLFSLMFCLLGACGVHAVRLRLARPGRTFSLPWACRLSQLKGKLLQLHLLLLR